VRKEFLLEAQMAGVKVVLPKDWAVVDKVAVLLFQEMELIPVGYDIPPIHERKNLKKIGVFYDFDAADEAETKIPRITKLAQSVTVSAFVVGYAGKRNKVPDFADDPHHSPL
jgi:hypothetical protein